LLVTLAPVSDSPIPDDSSIFAFSATSWVILDCSLAMVAAGSTACNTMLCCAHSRDTQNTSAASSTETTTTTATRGPYHDDA
jgi:hypothetical protein